MTTHFTIIFSLLSIAIHGICSADWNDNLENTEQYLAQFRERRSVCSNPLTKTSEKYFFRMYYNAASYKGKTTRYHDSINFPRPKLVTGWTIQGKTGKRKGVFYKLAGTLTEYVLYYRTANGLWKHFVNKDTGDKVFSTDGDLESPKTVTKVQLDTPVITSLIRLYPKDYEGFPYSKLQIQICPSGSSGSKKRKSTTTTTTTTLKPVIKKLIPTPIPIVDIAPKVSNVNIATAIKKIKNLNNELKVLEEEKKEIEKEIKKKEGVPLIGKTDKGNGQGRYILY